MNTPAEPEKPISREERRKQKAAAELAAATVAETKAAARKCRIALQLALSTAIDAQRTAMRDGRHADAASHALSVIAACARSGVGVDLEGVREPMRALLAEMDAEAQP